MGTSRLICENNFCWFIGYLMRSLPDAITQEPELKDRGEGPEAGSMDRALNTRSCTPSWSDPLPRNWFPDHQVLSDLSLDVQVQKHLFRGHRRLQMSPAKGLCGSLSKAVLGASSNWALLTQLQKKEPWKLVLFGLFLLSSLEQKLLNSFL